MPSCSTAPTYNCSQSEFPNLQEFAHGYDIVHIPLSLAICVFGVFGNIANVIVLSQPGMQSSTNLLMSALSIGEGSVMAVHAFYVCMFRIDPKLERGMSKPAAYVLYIIVYAQSLFHVFSSWMIVFLTLFRLVFMRAGVAALHICNYRRAKIIIITDVVMSLIVASPFLFAHHVDKDCINSEDRSPSYKLDFVPNEVLKTLLLISSGVFMKALPIVFSTLFTALLIRTLLQSQKRHNRLQNEKSETEQRFLANQAELSAKNTFTTLAEQSENKSPKRPFNHDSSSRNIHQTTNILIALTVLYIVTYLPQAIMLLLLNIYGACFEVNVYEKLGDFMDLMTLICNCGNFVLYCALSSKFRETFVQLFCSLLRFRKCSR
ncbi:unnamed protein product [Rodentolepis nana]|uniref:G_PROTEIN_RECEP_F1_2 domain-containing protein n=1 Tax=Rodentolepis nana TaxID=102285 RepID=A0A0R3TVB4_RODNA|nr:unnamed protein product [Rodentolepis nana]